MLSMLPMLLHTCFTSRSLRYWDKPDNGLLQNACETALHCHSTSTACCMQYLLLCPLASCTHFVCVDKLHHMECFCQVTQAVLHSALVKVFKTAIECAGRTEHLAQQLQAPFEWQPMAVHVVDAPAHLASLGLVPIHNKSASGALLSVCLALLHHGCMCALGGCTNLHSCHTYNTYVSVRRWAGKTTCNGVVAMVHNLPWCAVQYC